VVTLAGLGVASLAVAQSAAPPGLYPPQGVPLGSYSAGSPVYDSQTLNQALEAAKRGDGARIRAAMGQLYDPIARKIALWALVDSAPTTVTFQEADAARRELADWPRPSRRQMAAEGLIDQSGLSPAAVIAWFGGADPLTGRGALALATALRATGQSDAANLVISKAWRTVTIDPITQSQALAAFGSAITGADQAAQSALAYKNDAVRNWRHGAAVMQALSQGDTAGAYAAAANSGLTSGPPASEAQFMAGWIALTKMHDPARADRHFAQILTIGSAPITQSRGFYWRGRAADAENDGLAAQLFYAQAARYPTTFYGQLGALRSGVNTIAIGRDPTITSADRAAFEARDVIRATRMLAAIGAKDTFKSFVADLADSFSSAADDAMLVDLARSLGDQEASMRAVRNAARRGNILPERGYPLHATPPAYGGPEPALVLGITRQESGFDPMARSGSGARGMMQLMPTTAALVARKMGTSYSADELEDADYNMRLGSAYLGQLVDQFSGSYVMAVAGYNAGPGRPNQWTALCGDPRGSHADPVDFIECIPFSETRDYVMRVLEAMSVYRARLNGGSAPLTLDADLKRGSYGYHAGPSPLAPTATPLATVPSS
jgi:soluble lytic murein transglycosylase-like protein